ncbi:MAG TPA: hypothetical protein PLJ21_00155 [Pseudobdellovibrionaceae bacterium]|nr:hypothetical protein [Pseudobdellovibrionaceae bacterium]
MIRNKILLFQLKKKILIGVYFFFMMMISSFAEAQNKMQASNNKQKMRRQEITFEDELVQGGTQKPELFYLLQKRNFNYGKLIKMRDNFIPEMEQTAKSLQRIRRKN